MPLPKGTLRVFGEVQPLRVLGLTAWAEDLVATVGPAPEEAALGEELVQAVAVAAEDTVKTIYNLDRVSLACRIR
jgi:hypothetical protein